MSFMSSVKTALKAVREQAPSLGSGGSRPDTAEPASAVRIDVRAAGRVLDNVSVERLVVRRAVNEIPATVIELGIPQAQHDDYQPLDALMRVCAIGQSIEVLAGGALLTEGVIGSVQVERRDGGRRLRLRLKSKLQSLKATTRSRAFTGKADHAIVQTVLGDHGVALSVDAESIVGSVDQRVQWNCADWVFVRALLDLHGAWMWPQKNGSVRIGPPRFGHTTHRLDASAQAGAMAKERPGATSFKLKAISCEKNGLTLPRSVSLESWDVNEQNMHVKHATAHHIGEDGMDPRLVPALTKTGLVSNECFPQSVDGPLLQASANARLLSEHAQAVRVVAVVEGIQACELGDSVVLAGFGKALSGKGILTALEYELGGVPRVSETTFYVGLEDAVAQPMPMPEPGGLLMAKVAPFKTDHRTGWHRLPVTMPLLGGAVLWARWSSPYASDQGGLCFYPEEGDEVAVGWVGGDPVILGSLHNPRQKAPFPPSAKNDVKAIVVKDHRQKQALLFDRAKNEMRWSVDDIEEERVPAQTVALSMRKGISMASHEGDVDVVVEKGKADWKARAGLVLTTDEMLEISGKKGVKASSDEDVQINAEENVRAVGKAGVTLSSEETHLALTPHGADLEGAEIKVGAEMSVHIEADSRLELKAVDTVSLGGRSVSIAGTTQASLSSDLEATVKGTMVKVSGEQVSVEATQIELG